MSDLKRYNFDFTKKIFFHVEKIVEYKQGKRPFPVTIEVDLINRCNHKCNFCYFSEHLQKDNSALDKQIIIDRLAEAYKMGSRGISFTGGGEPMLHSDFIEIIEKTKQIGFDIGLMTNGSLMNENKIHNVINELQWIRISMGGGDVDSYRKIQGVNHFEKVMQNIELLSEIKKQENSNLNIGIRTLVSKVNLQSLSNLATRIKDLNINYLQLAPDTFTSDEGHFWFSKETHEVFRNIEQILDENKIMLLTAGYSWYKDKLDFPRTCYAHYFQIAIVAEGHLTYCKNARGSENYYIGNIYENTLEVIWGNDRVKNIESWIRPNNCNLFCRNMGLNTSLEETIYPDINMSPNFVN